MVAILKRNFACVSHFLPNEHVSKQLNAVAFFAAMNLIQNFPNNRSGPISISSFISPVFIREKATESPQNCPHCRRCTPIPLLERETSDAGRTKTFSFPPEVNSRAFLPLPSEVPPEAERGAKINVIAGVIRTSDDCSSARCFNPIPSFLSLSLVLYLNDFQGSAFTFRFRCFDKAALT